MGQAAWGKVCEVYLGSNQPYLWDQLAARSERRRLGRLEQHDEGVCHGADHHLCLLGQDLAVQHPQLVELGMQLVNLGGGHERQNRRAGR